ncbi:MaoC family dehydratase [Stakelama sediminis]|uniref:MaoC family dehydratase n=1 Tax=Stakelama sediminis TaxID=463200 RepID=UPI001FE9A39A|nr:MaoC family dehydratase [Stakelama sediminis]
MVVTSITMSELAQRTETTQVSQWVTVTQEMIDRFADATGDRQFIHIDPQAASATPFGGTIAHGFLTLSLMPVLASKTQAPSIEGLRMAVNYGCNSLRFIAPVRSGKRVRGHFTMKELTEKRPGQWQRTDDFTVEIEGEEKPALIAEWISQYFV